MFFTNSQDDQTTATVKILRGTTPFNELTLTGLTPKLKGEVRIKVMFEITEYGDASLGIEEVGTNNKVHRDFEGLLSWNQAEIDAYEKETTNKQIEMTIGADGIVGDLPVENGYAITYPIASNPVQRYGFEEVNGYSYDHFYAWVHGFVYDEFNGGRCKQSGYFLFVDLTPGQIASKFGYKDPSIRNWTCNYLGTKSPILNEDQQQGLEGWTAQDVYDKLVKPLLPPPNKKLDLVGILLPEGTVPNFSSSEIEKELGGVPVRWVHLNDLWYGVVIPAGITLANGKTVTIVAVDTPCPINRKVLFTNSQDNQTTATVKIICGTTRVDELTIEGLSPKSKGKARIKVTCEITDDGDAGLTIEEVGTDNKVCRDFGNIWYWDTEEVYAYKQETTNKQIDMILGADGIVGELPA
ncbi:hypothetical protein CPB86DRAFT_819406 [Serendipita vermifera]|nr:hypothetical protein CPB86DRAFT_819406 [Serendipita vermifera]